MSEIVLISGSPNVSSRSDSVLRHIGARLEGNFSVTHISIKDIPLEDLFYGNFNSPAIHQISNQIDQAKGIVIASPVYKAALTGVLKSLLDVLPQDIFKSKPVFPIMTGGSPSHLLALEYTLKPLISILKGHSLRGVYILDTKINKHAKNPIIDTDINERIEQQIQHFTEAIQEQRLPIS